MKRGEITVFFALLLSAVCVFFCAVIESARTQAMRFQIETLMDMGLHSCFGEYQQELFARYDLLYIDTSYGRESGDITKTLRHLEQYIEENAGSGKAGAQTLLQEKGDWFQLSIEKSEAVQFLLASDFNGHTLRNQAVHYIRVYGDSSHSAAMAKTAEAADSIKEADFYGSWEAAQNAAAQYGKSFTDPTKQIKAYGLDTLFADSTKCSQSGFSVIPYSMLPSVRMLEKGNYLYDLEEAGDEALLFDEYLLQKCADYTDIYMERVLYGELEYIIYGNLSDRENVQRAVSDLLDLRMRVNVSCLLSDSARCEEAEALAEELTGVYEIPELTKALKEMILYAWAYAESVIEVSCLFSGGRVCLNKQPDAWMLPLEKLSAFKEYMGKSGGSGLCYEEYLGIFLRKTDSDLKISRCMDVIEMNIRRIKNSSFRIDGCLEYMEAEVFFESRYGYRYQIKREFGYESK